MTALGERFAEAFRYALELHAGQTRKKTARPYIGHLLGVAALVLQYGGDEEQAIAALLHDAVEDAGGRPTLEAIRRRFGERVARIVEGCTDSFEADASKKPPWLERKRGYLEHVRKAPPEVLLVSAADKLYNVRELLADYRAEGEAVWPRFAGRREGTLWYYRALADAFRATSALPIVAEYDRAVRELERLAESPSGQEHL
jgi:GTP pyrophosphokinase